MNKALAVIIAVLLIGGFVYGVKTGVFSGRAPVAPNSSNQLKVVTSFYPLAHFALQIGGDHVQITSITPGGVEPHDYEPTPQDIATVYSSKVFIFNGSGVDVWADHIRSDLEAKGVVTLKMSEKFSLLPPPNADEAEATSADPHIWLDPALAGQEVGLIRDVLIKAGPANADSYNKNADAYAAQLIELDRQYRDGLKQCATNKIVTSHAAFGYLAREYGLSQVSISGLSPEEEPSPKRLGEIADLAKRENIRYIFFESLVSPKLAQTIAREIGAQVLVLNPIEGLTAEQVDAGETYITIMQDNLKNLRTALQCR